MLYIYPIKVLYIYSIKVLYLARDHFQVKVEAKASFKKVQVGKDQEKAQSEKDSHSKNRGGKKPN